MFSSTPRPSQPAHLAAASHHSVRLPSPAGPLKLPNRANRTRRLLAVPASRRSPILLSARLYPVQLTHAMNSDAPRLSLLDELDARQNELLDELDRLNRQIEQVLKTYLPCQPQPQPVKVAA